MKFTYNWLKDFVDIKLSAGKLAERLTIVGLEVTSLQERDNDWVYEIEITPNRPDLLSVAGIAREVTAITNSKLTTHSLKLPAIKAKGKYNLNIEIKDRKDCPLYTAKIIRGVEIKSSPDWLKRRLELVGSRPVNNIVDITNYVQLSLGQPLHAFDLDKLAGRRVIVRRAKQNEKIRTIDDQELTLDNEVLVIADEKIPIAVAGVMGSKEAEVGLKTQDILLESAKFNPLNIRHSRRKLGISSESSYRFERNVDMAAVETASVYVLNMIIELAGGEFVHKATKGGRLEVSKNLTLRIPDIRRILGLSLKPPEVKKILKGLGFKIRHSSGKDLKIEVPHYRQDINQEIDLIEEVARIWGYDRLPETLPALRRKVQMHTRRDLLKIIRQLLVAQGISEVVTYSLISQSALEKLGLDTAESVEIVNPLSQELGILRPNLTASLLEATALNINNQQSVRLFEIANVFNQARERLNLGIVLCKEEQLYRDASRAGSRLNLFHLKGVVEILLNKLGIEKFDWKLEGNAYFVTGQAVKLIIGGQEVGCLGEIKREIGDDFEVKNKPVFNAELYLDNILSRVQLLRKFKPLPLYPSVRRDISFLVNEDVATQELLNFLNQTSSLLLKEIKVVDHYKGKQIPQGHKSLTISCDYQSNQRTLTDREVNEDHAKICELLKEKFRVQIR
jgi:phenylalanyl-tRNA synthetase beta chain